MGKPFRFFIASALVFLGAVFIMIGFWYSRYSQRDLEVAWLLVEKGQVTIKDVSGKTQNVKSGRWPLESGQQVILDDISTTVATLPLNQAKLRLLENSSVTLLKSSGKWLIKLIEGELEVLGGNHLDQVYIQDPSGNTISLKEWAHQNESQDLSSPLSSPSENITGKVDQSMIDQAYEKLRPQLLQCYGKWVGNTQETPPQLPMHIHFKLRYKKTGVEAVQVTSQNTIPKSIEECFSHVLQQFRLSQYRGPEVDVELPLILE